MASPIQINVNQLRRLVGTPACPELIDVRIDEDFDADPQLIPGARRYPFNQIQKLAESLQDTRVVVYCQKGLKLSEGAAAILRTNGVKAEILVGGHFAWRDAGEQMVDVSKLPTRNSDGQTVWVTRLRPKIDRIACPWLIRRFIDPTAQFLFVSSSQVVNVAERFGATPFDIEGAFWSHRDDKCSFDTLLEEFGLHDDALQRLAVIVRGADTDRHDIAAESAGLLAASLGLSRMYADDIEQLNAGMLLYDAFYRWARDAVDEKHDWPSANHRSTNRGAE